MRGMLTIDEREEILAQHIQAALRQGWTVVATTRTTATFSKRQEIDPGAAILSFLLCGLGLLIYLGIHFSKSPQTAYIVVQEDGTVTRTDSPR